MLKAIVSLVLFNLVLFFKHSIIRTVRGINRTFVGCVAWLVSWMPSREAQNPVLVRLVRELRVVKNQLAALWFAEGARRAGVQGRISETPVSVPQRQGTVSVPVFHLWVIFLVGLWTGCFVFGGALCIGLWIGHLL